MMVSDLLTEDLVVPRIRASRAAGVLRELGAHLADQQPGLRAEEVVRALQARERLGSTAIGDGIAIPHAKLDSIQRTMACFGRSRRGIDFGAPDGKPTHFFFVLIASPEATGEHLKILARISRLFRDPTLGERLMAAETAIEVYEILAGHDARR